MADPILKRVTHVIGFREFRLCRHRDQMFAYKREGNTRLRSEDISAPCECSDGDRMTVAPQFSRNAFAVPRHVCCAWPNVREVGSPEAVDGVATK